MARKFWNRDPVNSSLTCSLAQVDIAFSHIHYHALGIIIADLDLLPSLLEDWLHGLRLHTRPRLFRYLGSFSFSKVLTFFSLSHCVCVLESLPCG